MDNNDSVIRRWVFEETNLIVTSLTACCVLYTRSAGVAYFAAGAVCCSLSVKVIKRFIRQPRPLHPTSKKKTYGMPSTHSATISHFGVYIPLACFYLPLHPSFPQSQYTRIIPPFIVIPWAIGIIRSRIWLGHHTWQQCAVGCLYGISFSLVWFALWVNGVNKYGRIVEEEVNRLIPW
ncbi:uncharacterized protein FOMMEDRAFT_19035 [Fomitiporia mediterranea MF3/22]|uniref:uncharacterized protein n=1 Tax=Fomitiporia mediterranea (strain MF3/22) TaxID=694068 RepID=UPI00044094AB|nr:uncharacterized protein FOMMEDRAFT_19035 [Fomitiporia mediterranea MF3/22]EJD03646.1 hypothetical protein FOMMEDRAFT_19035 [Fomitiporia mediterranea MF3/22]